MLFSRDELEYFAGSAAEYVASGMGKSSSKVRGRLIPHLGVREVREVPQRFDEQCVAIIPTTDVSRDMLSTAHVYGRCLSLAGRIYLQSGWLAFVEQGQIDRLYPICS